MALKRRDVNLAVIASFLAWVYAVNSSPIIRWASYAFFTGLLLPVCGLTALTFLTSRGSQQRRIVDVQKPRRPAFITSIQWRKDVTALRRRQSYKQCPLCPESFMISDAFDELLKLVVKDFIDSWYSHISKDPVFTNEVDKIMRHGLASLRDRLFELDLTTVLTTRFVPIFTAHFREYTKAERTIRGEFLNRTITESEELDFAIAAKYNAGKLHPAVSSAYSDTKLVQQGYLRTLTKELLPRLLPKTILSSRVVSVLLNELVSCAILFPVIQSIADPDTWNQIIESHGRSMLQDRSTVRKLRFALDQHASPTPRITRSVEFPRLAPGDHQRKFEKFIRAIRKANNLSEARRFRSEISSQLKRDSLQEGQDPVYLRRLEIGKRILDQRVDQLTNTGEKSYTAQRNSRHDIFRLENASLVDLLHDPSGLTYFMEYMDRLNLMPLVQFWIVVDGFRTPLEDDFADDDIPTNPPWTDADRTDLAQINDVYLSKLDLKISDSSRQLLQDFLESGKEATPRQYHLARRSILRAQTTALEVMQDKHFQNFKKSDLFYKCLTSQEAMKAQRQDSPPPTVDIESKKRQPPVRSSSWQAIPRPLTTPKVLVKPAPRRGESRRQAASSLDLTSATSGLDSTLYSNRSFDAVTSSSLYENQFNVEGLGNKIQSVNQETEGNVPDNHVVKAMEVALNTILGDKSDAEDLRSSLFGDEGSISSLSLSQGIHSSRNSLDQKRADLFGERLERPTEKPQKPNISSLGLVNVSSRIGVFTDDDLFQDEERFISDEHDDPEDTQPEREDEVHEAAPGDLGLAEEIAALTVDIERLTAQDAVVNSMTRKAELTNNTAELRILKKSKASLQREIRHKELQRRQYIIQESDNSLYGRSTIKIKSTMVGKEEDGKEFAIYVIEVQRQAGEQIPAAVWTITRRYSEFLEMHQKLREKYASIRNLEFPRRRMVMKLQPDFLYKRRIALEKYLRQALLIPEVCRCRELRTFLSESSVVHGSCNSYENDENKKDLITRLYNSFTDSIEDMFGGIPVFDQLSVTGQNLISVATQQLLNMPATMSESQLDAEEAEAELNAFENRELEPFVKPICDMFLEIFELNRSNNWLRGRAVVVVLHQLLGSTIERKVRETVKGLFSEESVIKYITLVRDCIWHDGELKKDQKPRTPLEKSKSRSQAGLLLATLVPDLASSVVGRVNAQAAGRRIFATLNNPRLNVHLVYTLLDEIIDVLFSEKRT
ncbi:hypothetical protein K3495_g10277 [Podosphaera aphanis]|nr:hypothetical protein K3495_g10277 [Podosphaera aphanis]